MRFTPKALILASVMALGPVAALAEQLSLNEVSGYLNTLQSVKGDFTQINDDGSIATGTISIKRPGKARFEYDPPVGSLVVVGANTVVIYDEKSNQPAESFPLDRTPLSILLARHVDLGQARMVTGHAFDGTATVVTAQDPEHPEYGSIQLKFTSNPVQLRQWVIDDGSGNLTTVVLGELRRGVRLPNKLFDVGEAQIKGGR